MQKRISLIDGNSVGHAAHRATKLRSGDMETQAVFGMLRSIRDMKVERPNFEPIVLWDGRAQWRFDLHPEYKSNRDNDPKCAGCCWQTKPSDNLQSEWAHALMINPPA